MPGFRCDGNDVLGALGGALTAMVWLYLLSVGLLVGAELNAVLLQREPDAHQRHDHG